MSDEKESFGEILNDIAETIVENSQTVLKSETVSSQFNRLFGRQKPVHQLLGGGKSADVLLWRNRKISASVLIGATAIWAVFEWLNYHFLTILCFLLGLGMAAQFVWVNASGTGINSLRSKPPRLTLPEELFVNVAIAIGAEVNRALGFLQDIACGGSLKQVFSVVGAIWFAGLIAIWCNLLTVVYIGFVAAHTLPVLYEKYEDEVDAFVYKVLEDIQTRCQQSDFLKKMPRGKILREYGRKHE